MNTFQFSFGVFHFCCYWAQKETMHHLFL